jgi:hypothetical protein
VAKNKAIVDIAIHEAKDHDAVSRLHLRGFLGDKAAKLLHFRAQKKAQKEIIKEQKAAFQMAKKKK